MARRWWLLGFLLGVACGDGPGDPSEPAVSLTNVPYGSDRAQVMDLELPAGRTGATAVVVFIHGGGWSGGDKSIFLPVDLHRFAAAGFATANINYRVANGTIHDPVLSQDVTAALDFVAANAGEYQVSPNRFALVGHSAGAHLALLAAYRYDPARRIKAVASLAGPTDLTDPSWLQMPGIRSTIENYLGVSQAQAPDRWIGASPLLVATALAPPTILVYGQQDILVPFTQGDRLAAALGQLGVPVDHRRFPTYNHDLGYVTNFHFPDDVMDPIVTWFTRYLK
jgi:acetyl esterase/lipase